MKILIVRTFPTIMDLNTYNIQEIGLAKALTVRGHECGIVLYNGKCSDSLENFVFKRENKQYKIKIYWLKGYSIYKNGFMPSLKKIVPEYDVIQANEYDQISSWLLYTKQKKPTVIYHGPYYHEYAKGYNIKCKVFDSTFLKLRRYKDVITLTKSEPASEFIRSKGFINVYTVGVGIDENNFCQGEDTINCPIETDESKFRLLYIGKIEERRNVFFLIEVFEKLASVYGDMQLIIVGGGEMEYVEKFKEKIKYLKELKKVIYIPRASQKEVALIYQNCDLFVFPSNYEIFGMVLLEAMYFSTPVISSSNGGASVLIDDGVNGYIIDTFEIDKWIQKIDMLKKNTELFTAMKENAHKKIFDKFLWDKLADSFIEGYDKAIEQYKNGAINRYYNLRSFTKKDTK